MVSLHARKRKKANSNPMTDRDTNLSWIHEQQSWFIVLLLLIAMVLSAELGYQLGHRRHPHTHDDARRHFNSVLASLLGLLALLLGFTFHMSDDRYETRRQLVINDANALEALYDESALLPERQRQPFKLLLRQYVDVRSDPALFSRRISRPLLAQ